MSGGVGSHRNGSAGSSPDFPGYDSAEYGESPPDSTNRGSTGQVHQAYTPPSLETYASAPMTSGMPYHTHTYSSSGPARTVYDAPAGQPVTYSNGGPGYVSFGPHRENVVFTLGSRPYVYTANGGDYPSPPGRSYPNAQPGAAPTWTQSNYNFGGSSSR